MLSLLALLSEAVTISSLTSPSFLFLKLINNTYKYSQTRTLLLSQHFSSFIIFFHTLVLDNCSHCEIYSALHHLVLFEEEENPRKFRFKSKDNKIKQKIN